MGAQDSLPKHNLYLNKIFCVQNSAVRDVQRRAGRVEPLRTSKAQLPVLRFWQSLGCGAGNGGPPQLQLVPVGRNKVCKPARHSFAESMGYFENIQFIAIDIHEKALKDLSFWFLLKKLGRCGSDGLIFQPDSKQLESCSHWLLLWTGAYLQH